VRFFGKVLGGQSGGVEISAMMPQNQHFWAQKFANPQGAFVTLQQEVRSRHTKGVRNTPSETTQINSIH
jgi:hypothetical protein